MNNKYQNIIDAVNTAAKECGLSDFEIYLSKGESLSCETFRDEISEFSSSNTSTLFFRCIKDGKLGYATTQSMNEADIIELVKNAAENAEVIEKTERAIIYDGKGEYTPVERREFTFPSAAKLSEVAMDCRNVLYGEDEDVADGTACGASAYFGSSMIYNSKGLFLENSGGNCGAYMYVVVSDKNGGAPEFAFKANHNDLDGFDKKAMAEYVVNKAKKKFGAGNVKTGKYNIVFHGDCMAQILSTYACSFYAERAQKGFSKISKKNVGEMLASPAVTIIDTPFYPDNPMKMSYDGEGYPTKEKYVIKDGQFMTMLYNLTSAEKDGVESTGNASRGGSSIGTRVFSFYIKPGEIDDKELFKKAGDGIYITSMKGFHAGANVISGDFSIESEGFVIENGELTRPVRSFTVAGNFFELLKSIDTVSSEIDMKSPGYTQIASPAVLVPGMSVAGE